jgi:hypothetical protein
LLAVAALLFIPAPQLPAPISEAPETTPTPKPKREMTPRSKPKPPATPKATATPNRSFAGTWTGSAVTSGTKETCFYVIKVSDDEKTVLVNWKFAGDTTGRSDQATCTRFGTALSWSLRGENSTWHCTDTLQLSSNGTATFANTMTGEGFALNATGTFSRQDASSAPSVPQTATTYHKQPSPGVTAGPATKGLREVEIPTAKSVPGKPGYVFSPFDTRKYIDVTDYPSGSEVKDPYSGKMFIVP